MGAPLTDLMEARIAKLVRGTADELDAFITLVDRAESVDGTKATVRCHAVALDGNGMHRARDLARAVAERIVDFAIPRSEIESAKAAMAKHNSTQPLVELQTKARRLFNPVGTTGEPAEVLLYMLAQAHLRLPQLLCKMPHKTNSNMHVHGIDGLHVGCVPGAPGLRLYWGEAKMKSDFSTALKECLTDLLPYVSRSGAAGGRDLELARDNLDLLDDELETALLNYLNPNSAHFNATENCGLMLVSFSHDKYPSAAGTHTAKSLADEVSASLKTWRKSFVKGLSGNAPLHAIHLEAFLLPVPSAEEFRKEFLKALGYE